MANKIHFHEKICQCSNGCTDVLLTVIGLSGSRLARTDDERNMIVWLMTKDQSAVGAGTVGFDIAEMPWKKSCLEKQKQFMLQALAGVREKIGWETLDYVPNETMIFDRLDMLADMFQSVQTEDINEEVTKQWLENAEVNTPVQTGYPICEKHKIFQSIFGCMACNDR